MFARHVSMHLKPNTRAEFTQTIENEILPLCFHIGRSLAEPCCNLSEFHYS